MLESLLLRIALKATDCAEGNDPMDETTPKPLIVWRFIRRHFVRIVIGAVLVAAVYGALLVCVPYQREQRIAREIEAIGGDAQIEYLGPSWVPQIIQEWLPWWNRIRVVNLQEFAQFDFSGSPPTTQDATTVPDKEVSSYLLSQLGLLSSVEDLRLYDTQVTDAGLGYLRGLTNLERLILCNTHVTDAGLVHLRKLTKLKDLSLVRTGVTDAGIEHLKGLSNLDLLELDGTKTTEEGRASLRRALPGCQISPNP